MNKQKWIVLIAVLSLVGAAAGVLGANKNRQRLGSPGLKIIQENVLGQGDDTNMVVVGTSTVPLPARVLDFTSTGLLVSKIEQISLPKDTTFARRRYVSKDKESYPIDVSVVLMGRDRTSIHKPEICLPGQGLKIEKTESLTIPILRPYPYDLPVKVLTASMVGLGANGLPVRGRALFVYWFVSENHLTADHRKRVWWSARDLITDGVMQRWAYVACLSVCRPGDEQAKFEQMKEFIAAAVPEFQLVSGPKSSSTAPPTAAVLR